MLLEQHARLNTFSITRKRLHQRGAIRPLPSTIATETQLSFSRKCKMMRGCRAIGPVRHVNGIAHHARCSFVFGGACKQTRTTEPARESSWRANSGVGF